MFRNLFVASKNEFTTEKALHLQKSHVSGLCISEVNERQHRFGFNHFATLQKSAIVQNMWNDLKTPFSLSSLVVIGLSDLIQFYFVTISVLALFLSMMITKTSQRIQFNRHVQIAQDILSEDYLVIRDGISYRVSGINLVPGDIVLLSAGDQLPANLNLFDDSSIQLDTTTASFGAKVIAGEGFAIVMETGQSILAEPTNQESSAKIFYIFVQRILSSIRIFSQKSKVAFKENSSTEIGFSDLETSEVQKTGYDSQFVEIPVLSKQQPRRISLKYEQQTLN